MEQKNLCVEPSLYSVFLYTMIDPDWTKSDYILSDRIPLVIHQRLRDLFGVDVFTYKGSKPAKNLIKRSFLYNKYYFEFKRYSKGRSYKNVYGNDEFAGSWPYRKHGIYLIEDGNMNAESKQFFKRKTWRSGVFMIDYWRYWIFQGYLPYGWSRFVKYIYHTPAISLPSEIASKGILVDLQETWRSLSVERKNDILKLFDIDNVMLENINKYSTVLVTQSLPIPEEDKIAIYKKMINGLDESTIMIKTHYAEKTNYSEFFPKAKIISMPVPMQLFNLLGYEPKKVMTISSGAVAPFIKDGVDLTFLGTECDPRIAEHYGIITKETYMIKN